MVLTVVNMLNNAFISLFRFSIFSSDVPEEGLNVSSFAGVKMAEDSETVVPTG